MKITHSQYQCLSVKSSLNVNAFLCVNVFRANMQNMRLLILSVLFYSGKKDSLWIRSVLDLYWNVKDSGFDMLISIVVFFLFFFYYSPDAQCIISKCCNVPTNGSAVLNAPTCRDYIPYIAFSYIMNIWPNMIGVLKVPSLMGILAILHFLKNVRQYELVSWTVVHFSSLISKLI